MISMATYHDGFVSGSHIGSNVNPDAFDMILPKSKTQQGFLEVNGYLIKVRLSVFTMDIITNDKCNVT